MKLSTAIGPSYNVGESDTQEVKRALLALGYYSVPSYGLTPYPDQAMFDGIKAVQRALGLSPTGVMRPDGPEHRAIAASLEAEGGAGGPGTVHVQAYSQDRAGHAVQVSAHERGAPGGGANAPVGGASGLPKMENPVHNGVIRGCDVKARYGCGHFGAGRDHGTHKGVDIAVEPGKPVYSPVEGTVEGPPFDPYRGDKTKAGLYQAVTIRTDNGHRVRVMYITPRVQSGMRVKPGTLIGTAQDLSKGYPPRTGGRMTNHIHVDVKKGDFFMDPSGMVRGK